MAHKRISVGVVQANPIVGDIQGNLNLAISAIEDISLKKHQTSSFLQKCS